MKIVKDKYHDQWEKLGESDPYWAVLTDPQKKGRKWNADEFFDTGEKEIHHILQLIDEQRTRLEFGTALDFGCGVGRLSRALSKKFGKVIAIDISESMLKEAEEANQHISNIHFQHNSDDNLNVIPDNSVDFLYSNIVLQHMPKMRQIIYIEEFCRVLRPKGVIAFQTPSKCNLKSWGGWVHRIAGNSALNMVRRFKYGPSGIMEIHTLPKEIVLETLKQNGMGLIGIQRYDSAGKAFESYMYFAIKN